MVPVAEQGASSKMASTGASGTNLRPSDKTSLAGIFSRFKLRRNLSSRLRLLSIAVTLAPAAMSWAVLPPGAAQRSITCLPSSWPSRRAGIAAAASCTHHAPSANPASWAGSPSNSRRTVSPSRTCPPSFCAQAAASLVTEISNGGGNMARPAMVFVAASPQ